MADEKKPVDWAGIEKDYANSDWSVREIARWYQISETAIRKRAKQAKWVRKPDAKGSQPVRRVPDPVADPVMMAGVDATDPTQIVGRGHNLIFRLLAELDAVTTHHTDLADMIEAHEEDPRRRAAMMKAIELPGRANVVKALATAFKTWNEAQAPEGKKAQRQAAAEKVAGKFTPRGGPKLAVNNG
ncbi:hypothetical protein [Falsirhodobacter xinxiangensis]|uniref:hypothetical protein n=1 Tax=Falsirhodobacter xinxiangensis TaxID=2530049 RepID=UPI001C702E1B|nr:hypothetical protein [Rhodobacter xinxiangensis]